MSERIIIEIPEPDFWEGIIQDAVSGVFIGLTLALIGYYFWKKQNLYSKKFEVYINVIAGVEEIYRVVFHDVTFKGKSFIDEHLALSDDHIKDLRKNKILFNAFFGDQYNEKIEYFINVKKHLEEVIVTTHNERGGSTSVLIAQKDQTPEILNYHKQMVINKMGEYLEELKLVNQGLKKYALIKDSRKKRSKKK